MTVGTDAGAVAAIAIGAEKAADRNGACGRADDIPRRERFAGALPRTAQRATVEHGDLRRVRRNEEMAESRIEIFDHVDDATRGLYDQRGRRCGAGGSRRERGIRRREPASE